MIHSNKRLIITHANSQKKLIILSLHWVRFNEVKRKVSSIYIDVVLKHFYIDKTIFLLDTLVWSYFVPLLRYSGFKKTKTSCFDKKNFLTNVRLDSSNYSKLAYSPKLFI